MSAINTNGIDVNYPIPGQNNSSQGFRDNFASIKTNLNTAGDEISDLQNKVVVKSALDNTVINNDMGNTLISNCATRSFRATTYNLGNALSGTVAVDVSLGDVQYGTVAGNVQFTFGNWAPYGTQSNVELQLAVSNSSAVVSWPAEVVSSNNNFGLTTLENYGGSAGSGNISVPYGVTQLNYRLSSTDCGNTIIIEPINRPRQSTQLQQRNPAPTGYQGDVAGTVALGDTYAQLDISSTNSSDYFTTGNTSQLYTDLPIVFTGVSMEANITIGTTYYVRNVVSSTNFTVSSTLGGANVNLAGNSSPTSSMYGNPVSYAYVCTDTYNSTAYSKTVTDTTTSTNVITLNNTTSLTLNSPIVFSGTTFGGIVAGVVYYIKSIPSGTTITVSRSRTNGVADSTVLLTTASGSCSATSYVGSDIWKRLTLNAW
jgi:hypothetical protein